MKRFTATLFLLLCAGACTGGGIDEGRFPVCKSNEDCAARDAGPTGICWNLRCVECRYDTDCAAGAYCAEDRHCQVLAAPVAEETGPKGWDPNNVDECIKGCKDKPCIDGCATRFPEGKTKTRRR